VGVSTDELTLEAGPATGEMSLFELTSAYTVFANRGNWRTPTPIRRVVDRHGRELYRAPADERAVISEATAYLMTGMMADVVSRGTAATARASGFRHAAAGKTGTSQSYNDAWFVGYTPALVSGVWIGFDTPQPISKRGYASVVAVPVWARFMAAALEGTRSEWFEMPASVTKVRLCKLSGRLATERCDLPVIESRPYDPAHPFARTTAVVHEGGTYDEVRRSYRQPEPCSLLHGDGVADHLHPDAATASLPAARVHHVRSTSAAAAPPSMRPTRSPVLTLDPGSTRLRAFTPRPSVDDAHGAPSAVEGRRIRP
jgi:membrane carboxypeptidase/penicillin-binding protein